MRRPYSPQTTVVPFVDPPVATRGRPFIFFFLRSIFGSSHDPARMAVAENCLTRGAKGDGAAIRDEKRDVA